MERKRNVIIFLITVLLQSAQSNIFDEIHWSEDHPNNVVEGPRVDEICEEQGICNLKSTQNYPQELVTSLLEELKTKNVTKFTIENSMAEPGDFESICSFKEQIFYPRAAKNGAGNWQFILNGNFQPFQGFLVEICKKDCLLSNLPFSSDRTLKCVQRQVYRKMVYLDIYRRRLAVGKFMVPKCCSCSLV